MRCYFVNARAAIRVVIIITIIIVSFNVRFIIIICIATMRRIVELCMYEAREFPETRIQRERERDERSYREEAVPRRREARRPDHRLDDADDPGVSAPGRAREGK